MTPFADLPTVTFEGPDTDNEFAYRWYDADRMVLGRTMAEQLRWAVAYWHSFHWSGTDQFGAGTIQRPWMPGGPVTPERARLKLDAAFDFMTRLGAPFYCFHDIDAIADADGASGYSRELDAIGELMADKIASTGVRLLWGTANLTNNPRYAAGAATNPDPQVFAWAAHQVRSMLDLTHRLGGANYVLWGGREGYDTLLNTDIARELDQLGRFMTLVVEHKHRIGFTGQILIEPKPHEPAKHMYDRDVATVYGFLKRYGLEGEIAVNVETNHATLAGHSFEHEIATACALGIFGSVDINRGDPQNGWDTDQFPNNAQDLVPAMLELLRGGGFTSGGFNFDAKIRRQSVDAADLMFAHIGGVDTLARALLIAETLIDRGEIETARTDRYAGWDRSDGRRMLAPDASLKSLSDWATSDNLDPRPSSGGQERLEVLISRAC